MFNKKKIEELYPEAGELMWEPMLIWSLPAGKEEKLEEMLVNGEYFASLKKDGACYQYVKTENHAYLFGRTVSKVTGLLTEKSANVPHIMEALNCLPAGTVLVLEIYYPGGHSKDTVSIMGCLPQKAIDRQKDKPIHAYIHDILYLNSQDLRETAALERYNALESMWNIYNLSSFDFLELAEPIYDNILEAANQALAAGEEGLVLRKKDAGWQPGKRPAWSTIKIKEHDTVDLVCIGLCPPTKEYTGKELYTWEYWEETIGEEHNLYHGRYYDDEGNVMVKTGMIPVTKYYFYNWPSAIQVGVYDDEGNLKTLGTVSSGLSDSDKQGMAERPEDYIGKVVSLACMSIDKKEKTLRHPVFKAWRNDKDAKDCLISEVFK